MARGCFCLDACSASPLLQQQAAGESDYSVKLSLIFFPQDFFFFFKSDPSQYEFAIANFRMVCLHKITNPSFGIKKKYFNRRLARLLSKC